MWYSVIELKHNRLFAGLDEHVPAPQLTLRVTKVSPLDGGLTCTLGPAGQRGPRRSRPPVAGPGEQDADAVLGVRLQVPDLIGQRAHTVSLRPRGLAGPVLDLPPDDRSIPHDGVGVELDDQIGGACAQQLGGSYWCRRHCNKE